MRLDELLFKIDFDIDQHKKSILQLEEKKKKLSNLQEKIPDATYHNGAVCLSDIWDKISCMKIERKQRFSVAQTDIVAKFSIGQKYRIDNRKIYSYPFENKIASISWHPADVSDPNPNNWRNNIFVYDINKLVGDNCYKKSAFITRIKLFLIYEIHKYNLIIDDSAYGNEISKLLMLR